MTTQKKKDDELPILLIVNFLFTGVLIYINIWYSDWPGIFDTSNLLGGLVCLVHVAIAAGWVVVVKEWQDPNFDIIRKWLLALLIVASLVVGGFRVAKNERQSVTDDSNATKQEQLK